MRIRTTASCQMPCILVHVHFCVWARVINHQCLLGKKQTKRRRTTKKITFVECNSNQNLPGGSDLATLWLVYEALSNYHTFFQLYLSAPNMSGYLLDLFVQRERVQALKTMVKSWVLFFFTGALAVCSFSSLFVEKF